LTFTQNWKTRKVDHRPIHGPKVEEKEQATFLDTEKNVDLVS
jgi:hypothetical protein